MPAPEHRVSGGLRDTSQSVYFYEDKHHRHITTDIRALNRQKSAQPPEQLPVPKMANATAEDLVKVTHYIDGEFVEADEYMKTPDPSTGQSWALIPEGTAADVDTAVAAASRAFSGWSETPPQRRAEIMMQIADALEQNLEAFALAESRDQGKPLSLAMSLDIPRAVYNFRFFASAILQHVESANVQPLSSTVHYTTRMPVGVAGLITPWNLPLYLLTFKIAPAIATGNTVVAKPSEMTSVTAWMLGRVLNEAGLPPGVINFVFGYGHTVGAALVEHPDVSLVSFTGSTLTGTRIKQATASQNKKISLELGGKNPAIVFDDVDLAKCIPTATRSCFANQGEICLCVSRIFVQRGIYSVFVEEFVKAARALVVGDPLDPRSQMGALNSRLHYHKVKSFVDLAIQEGATIRCGESVDDLTLPSRNQEGYFMAPTVITDVSDESRLMQEEIFGPVVCIAPFDTEDEALERANGVKYGLAACVWTENAGRMHRLAQKLQVGMVWCNCWLVRDLTLPFGGMKASGSGREGAKDSIDFFTEVKTVHICMK